MEKLEKVFVLHRLFCECRYVVPVIVILDKLECSKATFHRLRRFLQQIGAPLKYCYKYGGYHYDLKAEESFELPGIWFTSQELQAFASLDRAVDELSQGLFAYTFKPFRAKLDSLFKLQKIKPSHWRKSIKIIPVGHRKTDSALVKAIASAVLSKQRLFIMHKPLGKDALEREISPQALVRYRDNWYVDAWCHTRNQLRTFAADRILSYKRSPSKYKSITSKELDHYYGAAFGIFTGTPTATAEIEFSGVAAEEVAKEQWHPLQKSTLNQNGTLTLQIPYSHSRELIMDILKWGELAKVKGPKELKEEIRGIIVGMARNYEK